MDCYDKATRSRVMRRVRATDTAPELYVRKALFKAGFRYRLHQAKLPGKPDIVLSKYRIVIFVNGCFWHRHIGCKHATTPAFNKDYWERKFRRNVERDKEAVKQLENAGWTVWTAWECEIAEATSKFVTSLREMKH
ncbi:MAG: DNA mismatch endonuclease Vsr [Lentisphaerae bacterium]|jgi:DNA mismatch endonuclease (patch repair protein)|nr:DNA mismatch endonuclease Vsr [Lentisphaerota bacterium]